MKVITEAILRDELRADRPEVYVIPEGKLLSPAAREYLQQLKIKIVSEKDKPLLNKKPEVKATKVPGIPESAVEGLPAGEQKPRYIDDQTGAYFYDPHHSHHILNPAAEGGPSCVDPSL